MPTAILIGPNGDPWDDGPEHTGVRRIYLTYNQAIGTFNIVYDVDGEEQENTHPSGDNSYATERINFNYPEERIIRVSGYIGTVPNATTRTPVVRSITFTTNVRKHGPYGVEDGAYFNTQITPGAHISGVFGRTSNDYLNAIGFHQVGP